MNSITIQARAKINLSLDVIKKREDGYHEVEMVMQEITLADFLQLTSREDQEITITTNCEFIPTESGNLAYQAAQLIRDQFQIQQGLNIHIEKHIPVSAGLAGGSSNAAAVIKGLNQLWNLGMTREEMMEMGVKIGADVPFCILGGAAYATGIGEKLTPIKGLANGWLVVVKPPVAVSTGEVYGQLNLSRLYNRPHTQLLLVAMEKNRVTLLAKNMRNVLESVTARKYPVIQDIKRKMMEYNALGSMMSGSGPTVFGIYKNYHKAKSAYENLVRIYQQTYLVQSISGRNEHEQFAKSEN